MLFKIDKEKNVVIDKDAIALCHELSVVTQDELMFIILAYDYHSIYHQYPENERVVKAKRHVFKDANVDIENKTKVKDAVSAYKSLQYDSKRETIIKYQAKIQALSNDIMNEANPRKIADIDSAIEKLSRRSELIQAEIDRSDDLVQLKGGGKLSFLEKWQKNRKEYLEYENYKKEREGTEYIG